jgi:ribonuclease BN (tRNA processing enzyme)
MKATPLVALLVLVTVEAPAQTEALAQHMTCSQAAGLVRSQGAILLHTSPTTYDRYVSGSGGCMRDQFAEPAWIHASDTTQCFIGYRCRQNELDNGR